MTKKLEEEFNLPPIDEAKKVAEEVLKPLTKMQLDIWGCKYHELIMG